MATPFDVYVVTPERELWSGQATMVVARGTEGEVGILAGHTPMLIQLAISPLFIDTEEGRLAAAVDGGFLHVVSSGMETRVDILAEQAELAKEIDMDRARELQADAERRLATHEEDATAQADLDRATVRLNLGS